ncbi:MAG: sterol desaturase family protein [Pseudomonadota bacterium]
MNQINHLLPTWLLVVVTLLLRGFISFFTHFLNHKIPLLWRLHRVHHMDNELDVSTTVRIHPLEMFVNAGISVPIAIALGLPPWILLFYELLDVAVTLFSHSNLRLPRGLERWLRYIIATPGVHTVHHSVEKEETDSNYSAVFPIWDIVFRTFKPGDQPPRRLGLKEFDVDDVSRFGWLLASPFRSARAIDSITPELGD